MKHLDIYTNFVAILATVTQHDEMLRIIQAIITCIGIAITVAYNIWKWVRNAKKGKLEEPKDITDSINDLVNTINTIKDDKESNK